MIKVEVHSRQVLQMLASFPKEASRAAEIALDKTAYDIRDGIKDKMRKVFDHPVRYTLNSLKVTRTKSHNMKAAVWFKEPERMADHYLVPQVEGGVRKLKGFERALDHHKFIPGHSARMTQAGNISPGQIRQILSVLGKAELTPGYQANTTKQSAKRNKKQRDFVFLPNGSRRGKLPPGVYQRYAKKGSGFGGAAKRKVSGAKAYQKGKRRGKFFSVVRARGLMPIMLLGRQRKPTVPLLPFYKTANKIYDRKFRSHFNRAFERLLL